MVGAAALIAFLSAFGQDVATPVQVDEFAAAELAAFEELARDRESPDPEELRALVELVEHCLAADAPGSARRAVECLRALLDQASPAAEVEVVEALLDHYSGDLGREIRVRLSDLLEGTDLAYGCNAIASRILGDLAREADRRQDAIDLYREAAALAGDAGSALEEALAWSALAAVADVPELTEVAAEGHAEAVRAAEGARGPAAVEVLGRRRITGATGRIWTRWMSAAAPPSSWIPPPGSGSRWRRSCATWRSTGASSPARRLGSRRSGSYSDAASRARRSATSRTWRTSCTGWGGCSRAANWSSGYCGRKPVRTCAPRRSCCMGCSSSWTATSTAHGPHSTGPWKRWGRGLRSGTSAPYSRVGAASCGGWESSTGRSRTSVGPSIWPAGTTSWRSAGGRSPSWLTCGATAASSSARASPCRACWPSCGRPARPTT